MSKKLGVGALITCIFVVAIVGCDDDTTNPNSPYVDIATLDKVINVEYISYESWVVSKDMNVGLQVQNVFNLCGVAVYGAFSKFETEETPECPINYDDDVKTFAEWRTAAYAIMVYSNSPRIMQYSQHMDGKYYFVVVLARWVAENYDSQGSFAMAYGGSYRTMDLPPSFTWPENHKVGMCVVAAHDIDANYSPQWEEDKPSYPRRLLYKTVIHEIGHGFVGDSELAHGDINANCCPMTGLYYAYEQNCERQTPIGEFHVFCTRSSENAPLSHTDKIAKFEFQTKD